MLNSQAEATRDLLLYEKVSRKWRTLVERVCLISCAVLILNLVFSDCGGLFGIVEFLLASVDSSAFVLEVVVALGLTWGLSFHPCLLGHCLQLFNPVPAYRAGILAYLSRITLPAPVISSVPHTVHGCRAPPAFSL